MHFIVLSADTAGLSQTQGCHSADVQSVSQCSEDRAGVCLIQTAQFTSRSGRALTFMGTFTCRNHSVSSQFGVSGELCCVLLITPRKGSNLYLPESTFWQQKMPCWPSAAWQKIFLSTWAYKNLSPRVQTAWGCWQRAGFLTFTKLSPFPISSVPGKQNSKIGGRLIL